MFSVLVVVHLIYFSQISSMTRDALADKALAVARSLADSPAIREGLEKTACGKRHSAARRSGEPA
ncbi:sensory histidine kinase DcuS [Salmonella enterica subsp. enterica serovar Heidelberg str. RI-11-014316]|nr:sensory histidine kinase DcuS [Salmonella enterica subsp. enterica serovar Heidelberg str. RI-11-014316]